MNIQGDDVNYVLFHGNVSIYPPGMDTATDGYGVSNETFSRSQTLFDEIFPSSITVASPSAQPWWRVLFNAWTENNIRSYDFCPLLAPNDVTHYMERLATAMTDVLRSHKAMSSCLVLPIHKLPSLEFIGNG